MPRAWPKTWNKITRILAMEWSEMIQYRTDLILWILTEATIALVSLAVWYKVAQSSTSGPPPQEVFTYYVLLIFVVILTNAWNGFYLAKEILSGSIVQYLTRPFSIFWKHIANNLVEKVLKLFLPLPVLIIILTYYQDSFSPAIYQPTNIMLFIASLFLASILYFLISLTFGIVAFWLEDAFQIMRFQALAHELTAGILIPFAFMPPFIKTLFSLLPFRYTISAPLEIILAQATAQETHFIFITQFGWIVLLLVINMFAWKKGLQRYAIPGQ